MSLHPPVLFIGDRPNPKKNLRLDVPFVGSPSYKTLLDWIYRMDIDIQLVRMVNAFSVTGDSILNNYTNDYRIVALGLNAQVAANDLGMRFFALPHPSGLNRGLNDKKELAERLALCRAFIYK